MKYRSKEVEVILTRTVFGKEIADVRILSTGEILRVPATALDDSRSEISASEISFKAIAAKIRNEIFAQKMSAPYGSNRSVYIAVGELLPTFIELGFLSRIKPSVYHRNPATKILHPAIAELLVFTDIKLSKSTSILVGDVSFRPWFA